MRKTTKCSKPPGQYCRVHNPAPEVKQFGSIAEVFNQVDNQKTKSKPQLKQNISSDTQHAQMFLQEVLAHKQGLLNQPNISSAYKMGKAQEALSTENFLFLNAGDESLVFEHRSTKKIFKTYHNGVGSDWNKKFEYNKMFNDNLSSKVFPVGDNKYRQAKTEFILIEGRPVTIQENLSAYEMGYISSADAKKLNQLGFEDLRNENTKEDVDGTIILFDCFPK